MALDAAFLLWVAFLTTWWLAAGWAGKASVKASRRERIGWFLGFGLGFALLFSPSPDLRLFGHGMLRVDAAGPPLIDRPVWSPPPVAAWALFAGEFAAFAFAWWARLHLGTLWSGMMTLREGHRVIDTGPYRLVRHPIYTGLIAAAWMLALLEPTPGCVSGAAVLTLVMSLKARAEESFLRRELGAAAYDAYAARTPMLVPFLRR